MTSSKSRIDRSTEVMLAFKQHPERLTEALKSGTKRKRSPAARGARKGKPSARQVQGRVAGRLQGSSNGMAGFKRFLCDQLHVCHEGFRLTAEVCMAIVRYLVAQGVELKNSLLADITFLMLMHATKVTCRCPD